MTIQQYVVTYRESSVLSAFDEDLEATFPELAAATLLTPSDVRAVVSRLVGKQLAAITDEGQVIRLTDDGGRAREGLAQRQAMKQQQQRRQLQQVDVVPDEDGDALETADVAEIDRALDEALRKLGA